MPSSWMLHAESINKINNLLQILVIENDTATVMGTQIAVDYENVTLNHLTEATPSMLRKMVAVSQVYTLNYV